MSENVARLVAVMRSHVENVLQGKVHVSEAERSVRSISPKLLALLSPSDVCVAEEIFAELGRLAAESQAKPAAKPARSRKRSSSSA